MMELKVIFTHANAVPNMFWNIWQFFFQNQHYVTKKTFVGVIYLADDAIHITEGPDLVEHETIASTTAKMLTEETISSNNWIFPLD